MRKTVFANDEYYHIYNRGTDKRTIFSDDEDLNRFLQSMVEFNATDPIGSLYQNSFRKKTQLSGLASKHEQEEKENLVAIVAYCLNPNHYHFILKQISERGIERYMHRLGTGYTRYFNEKNERTGSLFQGTFKSIHIDSNEYLLHVSAYVNLNDRVHQLDKLSGLASKSSWEEYVENKRSGMLCEKDVILGQFRNSLEYREFAKNSLQGTLERRGLLTEEYLIEND
ncbi:MAG: transposase [Candidatus Moranbacteria bacterium]|nr:transposase [Candidatus Moranbacteria bacterium]